MADAAVASLYKGAKPRGAARGSPTDRRRADDPRRDRRPATGHAARAAAALPDAYLGVFGSWARGEQREGSNLDLLVDFDGPIDLFAYARLQEEIASALGVRVDLVHRAGLKPAVGRNVLREVR